MPAVTSGALLTRTPRSVSSVRRALMNVSATASATSPRGGKLGTAKPSANASGTHAHSSHRAAVDHQRRRREEDDVLGPDGGAMGRGTARKTCIRASLAVARPTPAGANAPVRANQRRPARTSAHGRLRVRGR